MHAAPQQNKRTLFTNCAERSSVSSGSSDSMCTITSAVSSATAAASVLPADGQREAPCVSCAMAPQHTRRVAYGPSVPTPARGEHLCGRSWANPRGVCRWTAATTLNPRLRGVSPSETPRASPLAQDPHLHQRGQQPGAGASRERPSAWTQARLQARPSPAHRDRRDTRQIRCTSSSPPPPPTASRAAPPAHAPRNHHAPARPPGPGRPAGAGRSLSAAAPRAAPRPPSSCGARGR